MSADAEGSSTACFKVQSSASLGRHAVATRFIPAGSVILQEQPLVIAPSEPSQEDCVTCLGCCTVVPESLKKLCSGCEGPLCAASCQDSPYHREECQAMKKCNFRLKRTTPNHLKMLAFLRVLLQQGDKAERIRRLESHSKRLQSDPMVVWQMSNLAGHLMPPLLQYSIAERVWAYGVMEVNSFSFSEQISGREALVLMDVVSMLSHSCVCNAYGNCYSRPEGASGPAALDGLRKVVVAATDIAAGSVVTVNYTHPHMQTQRRRAELQSAKFFTCKCPRCIDPSELGINPHALCCVPCQRAGRLELPVARSVGDAVTSWRCRRCRTAMTTCSSAFEKEFETMEKTVMSAQRSNVAALEGFLAKQLHPRGRLHPTHELVLDAKYALTTQLYGRLPGLEVEKLSGSQLRLLSDHCRDYLRAAATTEPGFGLRMARVNLALNRTLLETIKRTAKLPPSDLTLARMKEAEGCLEKVHTALRHSADLQTTLREQQMSTEQVRGLLALLGILKQEEKSSAAP